MNEILKEVLKYIPDKSKICDSGFEGANIVLYTEDKEFFLGSNGLIKEIVDNIKKRVEIRMSPSKTLDQEETEKEIEKIAPKEAGKPHVIFDPQRSIVIIEAEKPGLIIGKAGELLKEIKKRTSWSPLVKRTPIIRSTIIEKIRQVLYENNDYRKKFLNKVGRRIYDGWVREKKNEWIKASFLGGARQVGRSCILLQTQESRILLDCGIDIASEKEPFPFLDAPEFNLNELDAIIVTHSHLDHCGLVPYLYKLGYKGPVYMTLPTRDISSLLALDYISVAQKEGNKTLYTSKDVKEMVKHCIPLGYEEVTDITPDVRLTFYNAGHTLGSAMCHLHIGNGLHNLLYTGDMNYELSNLLAPASTKFPRLETAIIESTYGGKDDIPPPREECEQELMRIVNETINKKGKVLLPVLGVGRSQEIMLILEKAMRNKLIPEVPIYIHGMVWDVTAIHTTYPDFFNNNMKKQIFHHDQNPFLSNIFKRVGSKKEMEEVINGGPCVILATSGMMVAGPSVEYFKEFASNNRNSLVLTCYQGPGTLGRRLENQEKEIRINNTETISVKMDVYAIKGFSGHSSRTQLMNFVKRLNPKPKKIIIMHGESSKCLDLASSIHKLARIETNAPKNLEAIRIR
ncbi:MAG: beta-CASP ribonuclease aCPSF1 [Nanoarchaeota archaeon]|nr:beta-CASP ribonuclease aCPSF1 [Nanoarchaeota archaeon]